MAKVRGSKQHSLVIKHHQPMRRFVWAVAALLTVMLVWLLGFLFGQHYERAQQSLSDDATNSLVGLQAQVAELQQNRLVDQVAVESARQSLKKKQQQISQLERAVAFYKGVMAPEDKLLGLRVERFAVSKMSDGKAFRLKWALTQAGKNTNYLSGNASVELHGTQAGSKKVLSLKNVATEAPNLKFKFRYFQNFSVQVKLPDQFVAQKVVLSATSTGKKAQTISQQYDWVVEETLVDVE